MIIVYFLSSGKTKKFKSVKDLTAKIRGVSPRRVMRCISNGQRWKGMVFDLVSEGTK